MNLINYTPTETIQAKISPLHRKILEQEGIDISWVIEIGLSELDKMGVDFYNVKEDNLISKQWNRETLLRTYASTKIDINSIIELKLRNQLCSACQKRFEEVKMKFNIDHQESWVLGSIWGSEYQRHMLLGENAYIIQDWTKAEEEFTAALELMNNEYSDKNIKTRWEHNIIKRLNRTREWLDKVRQKKITPIY